MKREKSGLLFSPSDLIRFVESPFASWMERLCLEQPDVKKLKDPTDPLLSYLAEKGIKHEADFLAQLKADYDVVEIDESLPNKARIEHTQQAMKAGAEVIFQGCLRAKPFQGFADFLVKVDKPSQLGEYSYEPWDTKLSKQPKAYFIIQLCCYADLLESMQGTLPDNITVVLGTGEKLTYRTLDFWAFYQSRKQAFLQQQENFAQDRMPDPFSSNSVGDWTQYVDTLREEWDHLSKIANITKAQISKLQQAGIHTCEELINDDKLYIKNLPVQITAKLKHQAMLQKETEQQGKLAFEVLPVDKDNPKGLATLPPHSKNDVFFDLEGFPLEENGLEYLWGCTYFDQTGQRQFWERWAHDHLQERRAFVDFIDFVYERWRTDPSMHIYHYGHYEVSVCKRLMGRYGEKELEVDALLRAGVFVDLYKVIQHGLILGAPSYSIKQAEQLFREKRDTDVASGGESVVVYAKWQETPDGDTWQTSEVLKNIRDYNIDDCQSTQELTAWLRQLQQDNGIAYIDTNQSQNDSQQTHVDIKADKVREIENNLRDLAANPSTSEDNSKIALLLADLVDFFSRENKPTWWRYFERKDMDYEALYDDPDCIVDCERTATPPKPSNKNGTGLPMREYQFNPQQEFRDRRFKQASVVGANNHIVTVSDIDTKQGRLWIREKRNYVPPEYLSLIAYEYVNPGTVQDMLRAAGVKFSQTQQITPPLADFLLRRPPNLPRGLLQQIDQARDAKKLHLITQAVCQLDNSFLSIQGPPGTGKTYTASHVIIELLKRGKRIGISSNSHKAINNLMSAVAKRALDANLQFPMMKVQNDDDDEMFSLYPIEQLRSRESQASVPPGGLFGATAWGMSKNSSDFDYLFIDEAGQVSVAYMIAMAHNSKNIVVMGDQMQLPQPLQGTHPGESGQSILDYQLHGHRTVPVERGIFLNRSYRMHKDVNHFISEMIYEGRLDNDPLCDKQTIQIADAAHHKLSKQAGILPIAINHKDNKQHSPEEVREILKLVDELLKSHHTNKAGISQPITPADILVVAPFNHQVNELKKALGFNARVGTVDMFQGQEAPVVIISMTASKATDSARGADFLLSINRLNVAVSRAQALAIVVHSTTLLEGSPNKIDQIRQFNLFQQLCVRP